MESDLVKRLRRVNITKNHIGHEAADRIEALEAELATLRKEAAGVVRPFAEKLWSVDGREFTNAHVFLAKLEQSNDHY